MATLRAYVILLIVVYGYQVYGYKSYRGYKLLRLTITKRSQMKWVEKMEEKHYDRVDVWSHPSKYFPHADVLISPHLFPQFRNDLHRKKINFAVTRRDIQKLIQEQYKSVHQRTKRSLDSLEDEELDKEFNVHRYHNYNEIVDWMKELADLHPDLVRLFNLSKTFEGRDMLGVKIGANSSAEKPALWIDSGIHAREWIAPATSVYLIDALVASYGNDSELTAVLDKYDFYILPVANPDGYQYSMSARRLWRKTRSRNTTVSRTCYGVDANRNFDYHWGEIGSSKYACSNVYPGIRAFSEPESLAMSHFLRQLLPRLKMYMSLHSFGQIWLGPWGYTKVKPENYKKQRTGAALALRAIKEYSGTKYVYGSISDLMYPASGTSIDYMQNLGVPYVYGVELRPEDGLHTFGFLYPARYIEGTGAEMLVALKTLAEHIVDVTEKNKHVEVEVEDHTHTIRMDRLDS